MLKKLAVPIANPNPMSLTLNWQH